VTPSSTHDHKGNVDITDPMRRTLFEQTFGLNESDTEAKAAFLRKIGVPEEQITGFCRPGLHSGMTLGGAHVIDVQFVVEQVLFRQKAESVTLRVARDQHDTGHLRIEVVEVGPHDTAANCEEPNP
jgi:hypothetical protein